MERRCPECNNQIVGYETTCYKCGAKLPNDIVMDKPIASKSRKSKTLGILSLIMGCFGFVLSFIYIGIVPALAGYILAIIAFTKKRYAKTLALIGMIISVIATACFIGVVITDFNNSSSEDSPEPTISATGEKETTIESTEEPNNEITTSESVLETTTSEPINPIYDKEILFMDVPWGTSYTDFDNIHGELGMWALAGESYKTFSVDEIVLNDYEGLDFEYSDINIIGCCFYGEIDVAGYKTKDVNLYFSYVPVDGVLTKEKSDSALYGARYEFEPIDFNSMYQDLTNKISSIYGEHDNTTISTDIWGVVYTYRYWYGQNDTMIVLKGANAENDSTGLYDDEIYISYVWKKGDELLQTASDTLKKQAIDNESSIYGDDSINGL